VTRLADAAASGAVSRTEGTGSIRAAAEAILSNHPRSDKPGHIKKVSTRRLHRCGSQAEAVGGGHARRICHRPGIAANGLAVHGLQRSISRTLTPRPAVQSSSYLEVAPQASPPTRRIYRTPPPIDHSKLLVVDGLWCLIGSTNWDARSLRLNFEYNLECYDAELARHLDRLVEQRIAVAHRVTPEALAAVPFIFRLRNGITRLLSPYL